MTITYSLTPIPRWYFSDLTGIPAGSAQMFTYRSLNKTEYKPVFQDPGGTLAWLQPVDWDENGMQGPFYWEFDSDNPDETYYIEFHDVDGNLIFSIDDYTPAGGGGGNVTSVVSITNYIYNNAFLRNIGSAVGTPSLPLSLTLCPGAHAELGMPDIIFKKNNTNAIDTITFDSFLLGQTPLNVTPEYYLDYTCTNTPSGEIDKYVQFPITAKVKNLEDTQVTVTIWAKGISGTQTLDISLYQFFGSGGSPSAPHEESVGTINLTGSWDQTQFTTVVPSVSGKVLGDCGDDALYLWIKFPAGAACEVQFTQPSLYVGSNFPDANFQSHDEVSAIIDTPRTGDVRTSMNAYSPFGWVPMNDGVIGDASIVAPTIGGIPITRANIDTFLLFQLIWNSTTNTEAQLYDATGAVATRGSTAVADFSADCSIALTKTMGRALAAVGLADVTTWILGQTTGTEGVVLDITQMPAHDHEPIDLIGSGVELAPASRPLLTGNNTIGLANYGSSSTTQGGGLSHPNMQPTIFYNVFIKL